MPKTVHTRIICTYQYKQNKKNVMLLFIILFIIVKLKLKVKAFELFEDYCTGFIQNIHLFTKKIHKMKHFFPFFPSS